MKDPSGKPAPVGGFKEGGWYSGYQYYNGSFAPKAGMIHPNSPQQGAGQMVSAEVNAQSAKLQGVSPQKFEGYISQQNQIKPHSEAPMASSAPVVPYSNLQGGGGGGGEGLGITPPQQPFDLQKIYDAAQNNPELVGVKAEYDKKQQELIEAESMINDNPFFSEATRVGRIAKLREKATQELQRLEGVISRFEGDARTKMDIALKQYDINSQEYQKNLQYLNTLISTGAIAGANEADLSQLASMTGISSNMLKSVIAKANQGEPPQIVTSIGEDGALNVIAVDPRSGNIVNTSRVAGVGKVDGGGGGGSGLTATQNRNVVSTARKALAKVDAETNEDKLLSLKEYQRAVQILMNESGIDFDLADTTLSEQFKSMGYKKWKW